jgi:hypothetical protein
VIRGFNILLPQGLPNCKITPGKIEKMKEYGENEEEERKKRKK